MKYEELLKVATRLPFVASSSFTRPIVTDGHKTIAEVVAEDDSNVITEIESKSNAKLLAHSVNVLPKALEALSLIREELHDFEGMKNRAGRAYKRAIEAIAEIENVKD